MQSQFTPNDERWMREALELAESASMQADPNPHVGCVIVKNAVVVGSGATQVVGQAHAEVVALSKAGDDAKGATAYVTLEPCAHHGRTPPCVDALIAAKLERVVIACTDPNPEVAGKGIAALTDAHIKTDTGLLQSDAETINRGFIKRMQTGRPFVTAKMGVSVDGRSALSNGDSNWISNPESRHDAHAYRARMSAILTTAKTVLSDNPRLTARDGDELYPRQPLRIVLDPQADVSPKAQLFEQPGKNLLIVPEDKLENVQTKFSGLKFVEVIALKLNHGHFELTKLMDELGRREINNLLLEAGAEFQGACIEAGIVDEIRVYLAPVLLGRSDFGVLQLSTIDNMQARKKLHLMEVKRFADDVRLTYQFSKSGEA